jgi:hypothetical protein
MITAARICASCDRILDDKVLQSMDTEIRKIHDLSEGEIALLKNVGQSDQAQIEVAANQLNLELEAKVADAEMEE